MHKAFFEGKIYPRGTYANGCHDNDGQGSKYFWVPGDDYMRCSDINIKYSSYTCDAEPEFSVKSKTPTIRTFNPYESCCKCGGGCYDGEDCPDLKEQAIKIFEGNAVAKGK